MNIKRAIIYVFLASLTIGIAGCSGANPFNEISKDNGSRKDIPFYWMTEELGSEGSLLKIEAAGSYEEIGYSLGEWYRERGFTPQPLNEDEATEALSMIEFYESVNPSINDQMRGMYAAFGLSLEDVKQGITIADFDGMRILLPGLIERDSCSVVFTGPEITADNHPRLGRNYDYPTAVPDINIMITNPEDGYPTAVMTVRTPGISAADGVNSQGLAFGFASVPDLGYKATSKPALISGFAYRYVLEHSGTVEEALELLQSVPISFPPSSPEGLITHIMLADQMGASAVVEFLPEGVVISRATTTYQVMTNSYWAGPGDQFADQRYLTAVDLIEEKSGSITSKGVMEILSAIRSSTHWSIVYDLHDLSMILALPGDNFSRLYEFSLGEFIDRMEGE